MTDSDKEQEDESRLSEKYEGLRGHEIVDEARKNRKISQENEEQVEGLPTAAWLHQFHQSALGKKGVEKERIYTQNVPEDAPGEIYELVRREDVLNLIDRKKRNTGLPMCDICGQGTNCSCKKALNELREEVEQSG